MTHTTADEINFLDRLGTFIPRDQRSPYQEWMSERQYRVHLLKNYLSAGGRRADWGGVNSIAVINYARDLLRQLAAGKSTKSGRTPTTTDVTIA